MGVVLNRESETRVADAVPQLAELADDRRAGADRRTGVARRGRRAGRVRRRLRGGRPGRWAASGRSTPSRPTNRSAGCACTPATRAGEPGSSTASSTQEAWVVAPAEADDPFSDGRHVVARARAPRRRLPAARHDAARPLPELGPGNLEAGHLALELREQLARRARAGPVLGGRQCLEVEQHPHAREDLEVGRVGLRAAERALRDQRVGQVEQLGEPADAVADRLLGAARPPRSAASRSAWTAWRRRPAPARPRPRRRSSVAPPGPPWPPSGRCAAGPAAARRGPSARPARPRCAPPVRPGTAAARGSARRARARSRASPGRGGRRRARAPARCGPRSPPRARGRGGSPASRSIRRCGRRLWASIAEAAFEGFDSDGDVEPGGHRQRRTERAIAWPGRGSRPRSRGRRRRPATAGSGGPGAPSSTTRRFSRGRDSCASARL